jgi:putative endopeptidase
MRAMLSIPRARLAARPRHHRRLPFLSVAVLLLVAGSSSGADAPAGAQHGLDLAGMDRSVSPGDDFFAFANGTWVQNTPIPADRSSYGSFSVLADQARERTRAILEEAAKGAAGAPAPGANAKQTTEQAIARKVGVFYAAYMDEPTIEARGLAPLSWELKGIAHLHDVVGLSQFLGGQVRADVDPLNNTNFHTDRPFGLWVSPDLDNPARNAAYLLQGGLGMPDRDDYLQTDERSLALQAKYREHIARVLTLMGYVDGPARAERIWDLERKIAAVQVSRTDSLDVEKAHNRWPISSFPKRAPGMDWHTFFQGAQLSTVADIMVWQPSAVIGFSALVASEPIDTWKDYLVYHAGDRGAPLLTHAMVDEHFDFYGRTLTGAKELPERWKRAVDATNAALGDSVGRLYVARYFPPEAKAEAQKMVANIVEAFRHRIDELTWMSAATRAKAKEKLDGLYIGIGYPDHWRTDNGFRALSNDAYGNAMRAEGFAYHESLRRLAKPVDRTDWWMTPQTVNALNIPLQNALNFPAAILGGPFFDAAADPVQNYGGIGAVIGHEISHSFDDQGSLFDAQGRLANWWTPEDLAHFRAAADRLAAQYDAYEPLAGLHVNGKLTLSENIADVAGLSAAYDGYRAAYGGRPAPSAQGFTGDQRFFLSFAQIWRSKIRPELLRVMLMTNGHAPAEYRADAVRNLDPWYAAFDVGPKSRLYLAPDARVRIW